MQEAYRVFVIESGRPTEGAAVGKFTLKGAGVEIPAIIVGESGRGRELGVLPVANPPMIPCPKIGKDDAAFRGNEPGPKPQSVRTCEYCGEVYSPWEPYTFNEGAGHGWKSVHPNRGRINGKLLFASVGQTKAGKPKLFAANAATTDEKIIVVFRTHIGFRGANQHTGDRSGWKCGRGGCDASGNEGDAPEACPKCGATGSWDGPKKYFGDFPGEVLARGVIAEGDAGRAGSGSQLIAVMPKGTVFRTGYSGRLYGNPAAHYYVWNGEKLLAATWEERWQVPHILDI